MDTILIAVLVALVAVVAGSGLGFQLRSILSAKSARAVDEASAQQMRRANARGMGYLVDRAPGAPGHQHFFVAVAGFAAVGLLTALAFRRVVARPPSPASPC